MPRLLIDFTRTLQSGLHTGIQRVVRRLYAALRAAAAGSALEIHAVRFEGELWFSLAPLPAHPLEGRPGSPPTPRATPIQPGPDDHLLLADASWYLDPWPAVDAALAQGAKLIGMVHDLLPLQHPEWFRAGLTAPFARHLNALSQRAELLLAPSQVVLTQLRTHLSLNGRLPPLLHLPHGGDFCDPAALAAASLPEALAQALHTPPDSPLFLSVGTLEPRKNHSTVLDAFDQLWQAGGQQRLLLVGSPGWQVDQLLERIAAHPQRGRLLFHLSGLSDPQLALLYRQARALIYLSQAEGFGLPVLEARLLGCPVIAADIPVLREAGGDWPRYVPATQSAALCSAITAFDTLPRRALPARRWLDTAHDLIRALPVTARKKVRSM